MRPFGAGFLRLRRDYEKPPLQLIDIECRRGCGKIIQAFNRVDHGAPTAKYYGVCSDCLTEAEKAEIKTSIATTDRTEYHDEHEDLDGDAPVFLEK